MIIKHLTYGIAGLLASMLAAVVLIALAFLSIFFAPYMAYHGFKYGSFKNLESEFDDEG